MCDQITTGKPLIIGIGNEFRSDDGAGIVAARLIKAAFGEAANVIEQSGEGAALMEAWKGAEFVILIDAVQSGQAPGAVHWLDAQRQEISRSFFHYSSHAFGVAEAVELARTLHALPQKLIIHGIEGKTFEAGSGLSVEVASAVQTVLQKVRAEVQGDELKNGSSTQSRKTVSGRK